MKTFAVIAALVLAIPATVMGQVVRSDRQAICAIQRVHQCSSTDGCDRVEPDEVGIQTDFLQVDFKRKAIRSVTTGFVSEAASMTSEEGTIVLQGVESDLEASEPNLAYSLSIAADDGDFLLSVSMPDAAINVFGACTAL